MLNSFLSKLMLFIACFCILSFSNISSAKILHKERSLYQNVYVFEEGGLRCLRFKKKNRNDLSQSCVYLESPDMFVFDYYKQAMAATFFVEKPKEILIIGLGGGILANTFEEIYPDSHITSVEIDPVVVKMAKEYFDYSDEGKNKETHVKDGRLFVKRALKKEKRYDLILLDAFNGDYIPEHMMSKEYLQEVKQLAKPDGIIMANTFSSSKLFDHESATYHKVFGEMYQVFFENAKTNRVIITSNQPLPEKRVLLKRANAMRSQLQNYGVDVFGLYDAISNEVNWDQDAKILTDQFSPANLLKGN